jgi:hypothetical protein
MLVWSFVIAVTITPAVSGWWLPQGAGAARREGRLMRGFRATVRLGLDHPVKAVALSMVLPVMGFLALPTLTAQFFPTTDRDQFHIEVDLPEGTAITRPPASWPGSTRGCGPRRTCGARPGSSAARRRASTTTSSATAIRPRPSLRARHYGLSRGDGAPARGAPERRSTRPSRKRAS